MMKITPLQYLLLNKIKPLPEVRQALGVSRFILWQWKRGASFPKRLNIEKLIEFYGPERLDYNGCFVASVEITEDQARLFGLLNNTLN
jgi:hypothetical protein